MILFQITNILCAYSLSKYDKTTEYATIQTFRSYANLKTIHELPSSFQNEFIINILLENVKRTCEEKNLNLKKTYFVGNKKLKIDLNKSVNEILMNAFKFVIGKFPKKLWQMYDFTTKHDLRSFLEKNYKNKNLIKKDQEDYEFLKKQYENMGVFLNKQNVLTVFDFQKIIIPYMIIMISLKSILNNYNFFVKIFTVILINWTTN